MTNYVGFGFDIDDVKQEDILNLIRRYRPEEYGELKQAATKNEPDNDADNALLANLYDYFCRNVSLIEEADSNGGDFGGLVTSIINCQERTDRGLLPSTNLLYCFDHYVAFGAVRFADDTERARTIKSADDFYAMIGKYFETLPYCANIYEGSDWIDPAYWID